MSDMPNEGTSDRIERARKGADKAIDRWSEKAAYEIKRYADSVTSVFAIGDVRHLLRIQDPPEPRAWGAATMIARRRGWIVADGFLIDKWGSPKTAWRGAGKPLKNQPGL